MFRAFLFVLIIQFAPTIWAKSSAEHNAVQTAELNPKKLKAGQFVWDDTAPLGTITALVSIPEQRLYLYRNGSLIAISAVSTGKRGYGTPAGVFSVLEKDRHHRSRTYDNAPMPYTNRLTWGGVALHAGRVPGYPASHGCIRLPTRFARNLFKVSSLGMTVVVMGYPNQSFRLAHPSALSPVDFMEGKIASIELLPFEEFRWQPEKATEGAISIVMSEKDQYLLVYRKGIEIGRAKISMTLNEKKLGTHAFILQEDEGTRDSSLLNHHWLKMGNNKNDSVLDATFFERLQIPTAFIKAIDRTLTSSSGATLIITDRPLLRSKKTLRTASVLKVHCVRGNCIHGQGVQVYADGSKYIGEFKNGLSEGEGQLIFPDGKTYAGQFKEDRFQWN